MKNHVLLPGLVFLSGALLFSLANVTDVYAQARRARAPARAPVSTMRGAVVVKQISGMGTAGKVKTPNYQTDSVEQNPRILEWARVTINYETKADWIDELEMRYYVVTRNQKNNTYVMYQATYVYEEIPKGRHKSAVFLHPHTVRRYGGFVDRVAVEIYIKGELVATFSNPSGSKQWWRMATNVKTIKGKLLDRSKTPFAFIAYDAYQIVKPK